MTERSDVVRCVGGLAYDDEGRLLVVQRRNEPGRGLWSVPGGRIEHGETEPRHSSVRWRRRRAWQSNPYG